MPEKIRIILIFIMAKLIYYQSPSREGISADQVYVGKLNSKGDDTMAESPEDDKKERTTQHQH